MTATVLVRAGEELTISYLPAGRGSVTRRSTIRELWHFTCCCRRCGDPTELGSHASTVLCRWVPVQCSAAVLLDRQCGGLVLALQPADLDSDYGCGDCGAVVSRATMLALVNTLQDQVKATPRTDLAMLGRLMEALARILHPQHFLLLELKQRWVDAAMGQLDKQLETLEKVS